VQFPTIEIPGTVEKYPIGHFLQSSSITSDATASPKRPAGQSLHCDKADFPASFIYLPTGHSLHEASEKMHSPVWHEVDAEHATLTSSSGNTFEL
jgi:hypothetical protein